MSASSRLAASLLGLALLLALGTTDARAGAFLFAGAGNGTDLIAHPTGYTGSGGTATVTVCIDPTSANAAQMAVPLQNIAATWNAHAATTGNVKLGGSNDIPSGQIDFESVALHEVGHCIGLAHPNLATESGLGEPDRNYTKTTAGSDGSYDLGVGADGVRGSTDDLRGDDVNLHWFRRADNDPFAVGAVADTTTYSVLPANLPVGHLSVANADRAVSALFGVPNTESVMQQGSYTDEDQRRLAGDDVGTIRLAMAGLDGIQGTADDYVLAVQYIGLTTSCNVVLDFDDAQTGFAVCQASGSFLNAKHVRVTSGKVYFNTGYNWYFNQTASAPGTTTTTSTSSTTTSTSSTTTTTSTSTTTSSSSTSMTSTTTSSSSTSMTSTSTSTSTSSTTTSTTTSSTTPTIPQAGCADTPSTGCIEVGRGLLQIKEASVGHERLKVLMKSFRDATPPSAFGNPVFGASAYDLCIYDETELLVGALRIERAADTCGTRGKSCWRGVPGGGFKYADPALAAHGTRRMLMRNGPAGGGRFTLLAKNAAQHGQLALPTGITAALAGNARATVQLRVSDGACFEMDANDVRMAHPLVFRALPE